MGSIRIALTTAAIICIGCAERQPSSSVKIVNGSRTNDYPAVTRIESWSGTFCSGTFVSDSTFLTAAHCIDRNDERVRTRKPDGTFVVSENSYRHPDYDGNVGGDDLGVVVFPDGTWEASLPLSEVAPSVGDWFTIVGFGRSNVNRNVGYGTKRKGVNSIEALKDGSIGFTASTKEDGWSFGGGAPGDSGGPLILNDTGGIAGVTSGDGGQNQDQSLVRNIYVNVHAPSNVRFLRDLVRHGDARIRRQ